MSLDDCLSLGGHWKQTICKLGRCRCYEQLTRQRAKSGSNTSNAKLTVHTHLKPKPIARRVSRKNRNNKVSSGCGSHHQGWRETSCKVWGAECLNYHGRNHFTSVCRRTVQGTTSSEQKLLRLVELPRIRITPHCTTPMGRAWGVLGPTCVKWS